MAWRGLLVLAFVTVLLGAPSPASAASNALVALPPAPVSGSTDTTFVFRVTYAGRFEATAVTAQVAGRTIGMARVAGTGLAGTWSVGTTLPAGTWHATITALVAQGNSPSVQTSAVTVTSSPSAPTPPPTPVSGSSVPGAPMPSPDRVGEEPIGGGVPPTANAAAASTAPSTPPVAAPATPTDGGTDPSGEGGTGGAGAEPQTGDGGAAAPAGGEPVASVNPAGEGAPRPNATAPPPTGRSAPTSSDGRTPAADTQTPFAEDELTSALTVGGLVAVAAVALLGSAFLVLGRRRRSEPEPGVASAAPAVAAPVTEDAVAATLRARTVRRARARLDEDPILAALGIDEAASERRARVRSAKVSRGSEERPAGR